MNKPFFCITSDIDWASDFCIEDFLNIVESYGIKPTIFATHESSIINEQIKKEQIEIGIHPNFLPDTTQGERERERER